MQISKTLPQFERFPALFITSGEYEAHFYVAYQGNLELQEVLKMPPRDNAREKQIFTGLRIGKNISSLSHKGKYIEDLKRKFVRSVHGIIHEILAKNSIEEIYIFAPKYVARRIIDGLEKSEQKKVRMQFYKEYTKQNPTLLVQTFKNELEEIQKTIMRTPRNIQLLSIF